MSSNGKCKNCGAEIQSMQATCPKCGAVNDGYVPEAPQVSGRPKTISEMQAYCAQKGMPLYKMRFFIGENYREARAFGIYQEGDQFIVYKNKADGSRSIRYAGPDEAYAVNELFQKLMDECGKRSIYPEGKPAVRSRSDRTQRKNKVKIWLIWAVIALCIGLWTWGALSAKKTGYYKAARNRIYYHIGSSWYTTTSSYSDSWYMTSAPSDESLTYIGSSYSGDWGVSDFTDSSAYKTYKESHSTSSDSSDYDWDSWDSGDTDWDSDW